MFLVAWHVFLYLTVQFLEFAPAIFEWLGSTKMRRIVVKITIAATVFGVILSTLHQSALGALFLLTPDKLHPLWYSAYIPVFFFISAVAAGISMVILETTISHRVFHNQIANNKNTNYDKLILGLGKAATIVLFTYFCLKWLGVAHGNNWHYLSTDYGQWFLIEIIGFVLIPCIIYAWGVRESNATIVKIASIVTILGIVLNRINVSMIAYNWQLPYRYTPSWMELVVTITIITVGIATFRWIVNRMPVLYVHPNYPVEK
jgi:Ni/Fe-hydrogenase subunit HybB-like protein